METDNNTFEALVRNGNFVVFDTETTGLNYPAEIVSIAIIDSDGNPLLNTLVKPDKPIPASATAIHGITDDMVEDAPLWSDLRKQVLIALSNKDVIIYNAAYDLKLMRWTDIAHGIDEDNLKDHSRWWCAMEWYSEVYGEWDDYHQSYRWQRLTVAVAQNGLEVKNAHGALGDCLMTLALIKHVCKLP